MIQSLILLLRWNKKQGVTEVLLPKAPDVVWIGGTSPAHPHLLVIAESASIPENFWTSSKVLSDSSNNTLGFVIQEGERIVLRIFDTRTGSHLSDSDLASSETTTPSAVCSLHDKLTWAVASKGEIWAKRAQPKGLMLPPEPLSPLSYLIHLQLFFYIP